jgi:hypothetical protein
MKVDANSPQVRVSTSKAERGGVSNSFLEFVKNALESKEYGELNMHSNQERVGLNVSHKESLLSKARESNAMAEELLGYNIDEGVVLHSGLLDITFAPIITYSVSGELVTDESKAYFSEISEHAVKSRMNILRAGRDAGSPAIEILERIIDFNATLPGRYKDMANIRF